MNKFSILLLDDVSENIYSLKLLIEENFDINIFTALKAQEAIEIVMNNTIDLILTDPPYGTTLLKWDSVISFDKLWEQYNRIIKII